MKYLFKAGDTKIYKKKVEESDVAAFEGSIVHAVYATFALARDIEWATRQFVLEMKEDDEEGIGTMLSIQHVSPAFVGDKIIIEAEVVSLAENELICCYTVKTKNRLVAKGKTGQKILKKRKINQIFSSLGE